MYTLIDSLTAYLSGLYRHGIYFISDNAGWSFDWDIRYLMRGLQERHIYSRVVRSPERLRNQIVHFWDRYAYLTQDDSAWHQHNRVLLTWFHGSPDEPEMQLLFQKLQAVVQRLEKIVTSCETSRQNLLRTGIPDEKALVIPLGVDTAVFKPPSAEERMAVRQRLGIPPEAFCIGSFQKDGSGWDEGNDPKFIKGPDIFLRVVHRLAKQHPIFVLLTGPARGYVKRRLERLKIPYQHEFVSDYPALAQYYAALDAYLITSRDEGGPKSLMESWATGVPVVSTRMGMPADWIRPGENGLLAEVEDVDGLTAAMERLMTDAALRDGLVRQAAQDVQKLDWRLIATQYYQQVYQPLL